MLRGETQRTSSAEVHVDKLVVAQYESLMMISEHGWLRAGWMMYYTYFKYFL